MSIKCSLLGHSFGETTVEREREEEGTEVVITITEMETCSRCGESRVVSENKEVTTLETPEGGADEFEATPGEAADDTADVTDAGGSVDAEETADAGESAASGDEVGAGDATDAVILDDDATDESSAQAEARGTETTIPDAEDGAATEADVDADEDDAVIIGDDEGDDRDPGEWPDEEEPEAEQPAGDEGDAGEDGDATADEPPSDAEGDDDRDPGEWPDEPSDPAERAGETAEVEILGGDEGGADTETDADGSPPDDAATGPDPVDAPATGSRDTASDGSDEAGGETAGDDGAVGAWPEEEGPSTGGESMGDWPEETKRDQPTDPGAAGPSLDGEETPSITIPEGTFKCSECDFSTEADATSLRAGDFCPECRRGTLLEHADTVAEE
ncbi:DUF7093 family protein [Halosimplex pelagicum]|uniref:Uncharacterized protein n=1 Tax=Halosimplex pelagicum TaxID=869886 RepID=A0A7D5P682_9EURY|nr:hypothetical protein [Halosimplex pelagicum]QLH80161.1 hypothetical protein HZS54_00325 [Halosimplex pelagicum]